MKMNLKELTICILLASSTAFLGVENSFAITKTDQTPSETDQTSSATNADRIAAATKYKILQKKVQSVVSEAAEIDSDTQKAIVALENKDPKGAKAILQGVSGKLDSLLAKNPGVALLPIDVKVDVFDFEADKKTLKQAITEASNLLGHGHLQGARRIIAPMASEIRISTTNIPLGTFPAAIKQAITLIDSGKTDQAVVDLSNVLDTLEVTTDIMPLPVIRAEELLTVAADLEHRDDLSKEQNRKDIRELTDAAKDQLEMAQLLGYGDKKDYKVLYNGIDGIDKELFSDQSAATWQKIKDKLAEFKGRLNDLSAAVSRAGHPAK